MRRVVLAAAMLCHIRPRGVIVRCGSRVGAMAAGIVMMHIGVFGRRRLQCKRLSHAEARLPYRHYNIHVCSTSPLQRVIYL